MCCTSTSATTTLLRLATLAAATPVGHSDIQCPDTDKDGSALTGSAGSGDFVTCTYTDAGPCTYFSADGCFSSGSSTCPKGIAQDPSVTTDAPSSVGAEPTSAGAAPSSTSSPDATCTPASVPTPAASISTPPASVSASTPPTSASTPPVSASTSQSQAAASPGSSGNSAHGRRRAPRGALGRVGARLTLNVDCGART
ncbi:hypothetical protein B0H10DRAFT_2446524 [Mycena sp. CBHHK59/15]|nr:hypothetical protein B0H10DRAFT_2446524 [Mycena sp. CBHHK59/15]